MQGFEMVGDESRPRRERGETDRAKEKDRTSELGVRKLVLIL